MYDKELEMNNLKILLVLYLLLAFSLLRNFGYLKNFERVILDDEIDREEKENSDLDSKEFFSERRLVKEYGKIVDFFKKIVEIIQKIIEVIRC